MTDRMVALHQISGEVLGKLDIDVSASHYVVDGGLDDALLAIEAEMKVQYQQFVDKGLLVEAQRLRQRTNYDIEMMRQMGYCKGIENYARHLSGAQPGEPPGVLLDFFPDGFLTIIDESHVTVPQIGGMYNGDRARKTTLVDFGFRLPSALDNRPLQFGEFENRLNSVIYRSATPGNYELEKQIDHPTVMNWYKYDVAEHDRPTGLLTRYLHAKNRGQMAHLLDQISQRIEKKEWVLVTTVTKQLSEDIANFLSNESIKVMYLHSDIGALERIDILRDLRLEHTMCWWNLLREGLDLPEVSLVAILDADKEGFYEMNGR